MAAHFGVADHLQDRLHRGGQLFHGQHIHLLLVAQVVGHAGSDVRSQPPVGVARARSRVDERAHQPLTFEGDDLAAGELNDGQIVFQ